jgi:pimeloyl-ACP methyl ester carboxylesterase
MAAIVLVHGAFNELWGPNELRSRWIPALQDGLWHADRTIDPGDATVCFYGDLFRRDPEIADDRWATTRAGVEDLISAGAGADGLASLTALAGKETLDRTIDMFTMMVEDPGLADQVQARLLDALGDDTRVLVAHSLGTVVAVKALTTHPDVQIDTLITMGSPLGSGPFERFVDGQWPGATRRWVDVVATTDPVAEIGRVAGLFGDRVEQRTVDNGHRGHAPEPYLNSRQVGEAIAAALDAP